MSHTSILITASSKLIKAEVVAEEVAGGVISICSLYYWIVGFRYASNASLGVTTIVARFIHVIPSLLVLDSDKTSRLTFDWIYGDNFQTVDGVRIWGSPIVRNNRDRNVPELPCKKIRSAT